MPAQDPVLSICIPTFNRQDILAGNLSFHLDAFRRLGLRFEIVVVDDCSTDGTQDYLTSLRGVPELRYFRRIKNSGFVDNYAFAMRRAAGRYALFLGDDDRLIPERVIEYLLRMDGDPGIGMIQAPWLCVDERPGKGEIGTFYSVPHETRFMRGGYASLLQFIFDFHVFPEFLIVRREVLLRSVSGAGPFIFWAFLYTGRALAHSDIVFMPKPFARVTAVSDDPRLQQGNSETMFQWDRYRGGVEYITSLAHAGDATPLERRGALAEQINRFMLTRQKVSLRLNLNAGNYAEAYVLHHRMAAYAAAPLDNQRFQEVCKAAAIATAGAEAANFSLHPAIADPCIEDQVLMLMKPAVRERITREKQPGAGPVAYLRIDPSFPATLAPGDAIFDISDYIAQFV